MHFFLYFIKCNNYLNLITKNTNIHRYKHSIINYYASDKNEILQDNIFQMRNIEIEYKNKNKDYEIEIHDLIMQIKHCLSKNTILHKTSNYSIRIKKFSELSINIDYLQIYVIGIADINFIALILSFIFNNIKIIDDNYLCLFDNAITLDSLILDRSKIKKIFYDYISCKFILCNSISLIDKISNSFTLIKHSIHKKKMFQKNDRFLIEIYYNSAKNKLTINALDTCNNNMSYFKFTILYEVVDNSHSRISILNTVETLIGKYEIKDKNEPFDEVCTSYIEYCNDLNYVLFVSTDDFIAYENVLTNQNIYCIQNDFIEYKIRCLPHEARHLSNLILKNVMFNVHSIDFYQVYEYNNNKSGENFPIVSLDNFWAFKDHYSNICIGKSHHKLGLFLFIKTNYFASKENFYIFIDYYIEDFTFIQIMKKITDIEYITIKLELTISERALVESMLLVQLPQKIIVKYYFLLFFMKESKIRIQEFDLYRNLEYLIKLEDIGANTDMLKRVCENMIIDFNDHLKYSYEKGLYLNIRIFNTYGSTNTCALDYFKFWLSSKFEKEIRKLSGRKVRIYKL